MILIPKAKRVRIRVRSGDVECDTLNALRNNFSVSDVRNLLSGGSLSLWLRQQGENQVADAVDRLSKSSGEASDERICGIFFPGVSGAKGMKQVMEHWLKSDDYKHNVSLYLNELPARKLMKGDYSIFLSAVKADDIVKRKAKEMAENPSAYSPEDAYLAGTHVLDHYSQETDGKALIRYAAKSGYAKAKEYLKESAIGGLSCDELSSEFVDNLKFACKGEPNYFDRPSSASSYKEQDIMKFYNACVGLYRDWGTPKKDSDWRKHRLNYRLREWLTNTDDSNLLYYPASFIAALPTADIKVMQDIQRYYHLAHAYLNSDSIFGQRYFATRPLKDKLKLLINHFIEFITDAEQG